MAEDLLKLKKYYFTVTTIDRNSNQTIAWGKQQSLGLHFVGTRNHYISYPVSPHEDIADFIQQIWWYQLSIKLFILNSLTRCWMKPLSSIYHEIHKSLQSFPQSQESCTNRWVGPFLRSVLAALQRQNVSGVTEHIGKLPSQFLVYSLEAILRTQCWSYILKGR